MFDQCVRKSGTCDFGVGPLVRGIGDWERVVVVSFEVVETMIVLFLSGRCVVFCGWLSWFHPMISMSSRDRRSMASAVLTIP
jgi:hypothetical protein